MTFRRPKESAHEIEGEVADDGHLGWTVSGSRSCGVLAEDDVEHPVQGVLDGPVASHGAGELGRAHPARGDVEASLDAGCALFVDARLDAGEDGDAGEAIFAGKAAVAVEPADVGRHADDAFFDAAVTFVGVDVGIEALRGRVGEEGVRFLLEI